eukprot:5884468-Pleurochrysis_carterae.AAC.4
MLLSRALSAELVRTRQAAIQAVITFGFMHASNWRMRVLTTAVTCPALSLGASTASSSAVRAKTEANAPPSSMPGVIVVSRAQVSYVRKKVVSTDQSSSAVGCACSVYGLAGVAQPVY